MTNTHDIELHERPTTAEADLPDEAAGRFRTIHVRHRSVYRYKNLLQRATHVLRLRPFDDHLQKLVRHELTIPSNAQRRDFEEAFGNLATRLVIDEPHQDLEIVADSIVKI